jgi:hypothetical protein
MDYPTDETYFTYTLAILAMFDSKSDHRKKYDTENGKL